MNTLRIHAMIGFLFASFICGCSEKKSSVSKQTNSTETNLRETELGFLAALESTPELERCKASMSQLDALDPSVASRPETTADQAAFAAKTFRLTPEELGEFTQKTFNLADAAYLEDCLLIRSAVRGLDLGGKPAIEQAKLIAEWVCRTVYLSDRVPWPGTPGFTLEAGQGTTLARAYTILSAWQQVGLSGCFVGSNKLVDTPAFTPGADGTDRGTPAPVRMIGLKDGKNVVLFNLTTGQTLKNKAGAPLTWAELKSDVTLGQEVADVAQIVQWKLFLSAPFSSMTARMKWLQDYDPGRIGVKLAIGLQKLLDEYRTDVGTDQVDAWFPPLIPNNLDDVSYLRVHSRYALSESANTKVISIRTRHKLNLAPLEFIPQINLSPLISFRIRLDFASQFLSLHYGANAAAHHLIRGEFKEATTQLGDVRLLADSARTRAEQDPQLVRNFQMWGERLQALSTALLRAQQQGDTAGEANARQAMDAFLRDPANGDSQRAWIMGNAARPLLAESTFLLALSVHERTLRFQKRTGSVDPGAWKTVIDWWERYLDIAAQINSIYPQRDAHAKNLKAQAEAMNSKK